MPWPADRRGASAARALALALLISSVVPAARSAESAADAAPGTMPKLDEAAALRAGQAAIGRTIGEYTLLDRQGRPVRLSDYRGKPLLVSFIYTGCFQVCPANTRLLLEAVKGLDRLFGPDRYRVVSIGFNQPFDSPTAMRAFAAQHRIDRSNWEFLSPPANTVDALTRDFGFSWLATPAGFDHVVGVTVVDPQGRIYTQVYGDRVRADKLGEPLKALLGQAPATGSGARPTRHATLRCPRPGRGADDEPARDGAGRVAARRPGFRCGLRVGAEPAAPPRRDRDDLLRPAPGQRDLSLRLPRHFGGRCLPVDRTAVASAVVRRRLAAQPAPLRRRCVRDRDGPAPAARVRARALARLQALLVADGRAVDRVRVRQRDRRLLARVGPARRLFGARHRRMVRRLAAAGGAAGAQLPPPRRDHRPPVFALRLRPPRRAAADGVRVVVPRPAHDPRRGRSAARAGVRAGRRAGRAGAGLAGGDPAARRPDDDARRARAAVLAAAGACRRGAGPPGSLHRVPALLHRLPVRGGDDGRGCAAARGQ